MAKIPRGFKSCTRACARFNTMRTSKIRKKNSVPSLPKILAVDALVRVLVHAAPRLVLLLYGTVRDQFRPSRTDVRTRMRNQFRTFRNTVRGIADLVCARGNPVWPVGGGVRTQGTVHQQGQRLIQWLAVKWLAVKFAGGGCHASYYRCNIRGSQRDVVYLG
jgi:hypothetical protein